MSWMVPEMQLDAEQREFLSTHLRQRNSNIWIKGHAGSGKSVLLAHSIKNSLAVAANRNTKIAVVVYTHALIDLIRTGLKEIGIGDIPVMTYKKFECNRERYDIIFVDEVQDLPSDILNQMRSRAGRIIAAGDQMQSIYEEVATPDQIKQIIGGDEYNLTSIYRLTRSLIGVVVAFMGDIGSILSAKVDRTRIDVQVRVGKASNKDEELKYVWKTSQDFASINSSTAILFPHHDNILEFCDYVCVLNNVPRWSFEYNQYKRPEYKSLNNYFSKNGMRIEYVGNKYGSLEAC